MAQTMLSGTKRWGSPFFRKGLQGSAMARGVPLPNGCRDKASQNDGVPYRRRYHRLTRKLEGLNHCSKRDPRWIPTGRKPGGGKCWGRRCRLTGPLGPATLLAPCGPRAARPSAPPHAPLWAVRRRCPSGLRTDGRMANTAVGGGGGITLWRLLLVGQTELADPHPSPSSPQNARGADGDRDPGSRKSGR